MQFRAGQRGEGFGLVIGCGAADHRFDEAAVCREPLIVQAPVEGGS
jgi:hypothetical protein